MRLFPRILAVFLSVLALLSAATPAHASGEVVSTCISIDIAGVGEGVGVYLDEVTGGVVMHVVSGLPDDGLTLSVLIAPTSCVASQSISTLLPNPSPPGLPAVPILP